MRDTQKGHFPKGLKTDVKKIIEDYRGEFLSTLCVKVRNMKTDFNIGGTWRQVGQ